MLAAFHQLAAHGFEGLRTRDVAAAAGVNIATLHYYFPTKEAMIRAVLEHAMSRFRTTLEPHGSTADQLRSHLRAVRRLMAAEPELGTVMMELAMRASRDDSLRAIVNEMFAAWQTTMRGLLRRAARDGKLRPEASGDATAALIMGTLMAANLAPMADARRGEQAIHQLERLLGIGESSN
ncbi:MAG TPA: TetR/AcrR family transcriptional regulator [Candidatus Dormibacteraeota bacterium]|nr:TetR/AcrR family transcriptional regulator [Candidatus Dormibacteraeota bacterium]